MRNEVTAVKRGESYACDISLQRESSLSLSLPLSHTISLYLSASPHRSLLSTEKAAAVFRKNYQSDAVGISVPE